jgi:diguanylate cyclase (GGDEF)-like protein
MKREQAKIIFFLIVLFIFLNSLTYTISEAQKNEKIDVELKDSRNNLQTHYSLLLHNQSVLADAAYTSTVTNKKFMEIYEKIEGASKAQRVALREELYSLLKQKYETLVMQGVLQYQFLLPNNESFLRMHKPNKFGDDLSSVREDFAYTNKNKTPVKVFTQGRVAHGFRNTYPIFADNGRYLGAMEVSFSSDSFQDYLTNISHIHTHFLVLKDIFNSKTWTRDDLIVKYEQSMEHKDFVLSINRIDKNRECPLNDKENFIQTRKKIDRGIQSQKQFSVYNLSNKDYAVIASYFPIYNLTNTKALAWLVSYEKSQSIAKSIESVQYIRIVFFFVFVLLELLLYKLIIVNNTTKKEHRLINDILNSTDDIMFITDFKSISFSNKKFKDFFAIRSEEEFKTLYDNASNMFLNHEGYLHNQLKSKHESFSDLITKTQEEDRVVLLNNQSNEQKSFNISVSKISNDYINNYLITLTDITKMKEKESKIKQKVYIDGLTGVYNRTKFDEIFKSEFNRVKRYPSKLSLAIIDIDNFKSFNDKYGHLIGDEVLIMLAEKINSQLRLSDTFARWGGEEFVILFPETSQKEAFMICEKLRVSIALFSHPVAGSVTVSFGVTQLKNDDTINTMFKRCDEALYLAKNQGRNRVCAK